MSDLPVTNLDKTQRPSISFITCEGNVDYNLFIEGVSKIIFPIGSVLDLYTNSLGDIPQGWALADGSAIDPLACPDLVSILGSATLPNLVETVVGMVDDVNGVSEVYYAGAATINTVSGTNFLTLLPENLPPHNHEYVDLKLDIIDGRRVQTGNDHKRSDQETYSSRVNDFGVSGGSPADPYNTVMPFLKNLKIIRCY